MIVVPITGISFRRVSGAVLEDCRRRVEQVEIKSAPLVRLNLLLTEERRVSECHGVVTKARQGERLGRPPALEALRWQVRAQEDCEASLPKRW